ncbi:MAG TPA: thiamine-phosphate kinase [Terriglobales bacterium]|nr:thiamine-phosphate kinase [Terriglobales bacterium]
MQTVDAGGGVAGLLTGMGDDCAVLRLPPGHNALVTTDFSLEGVHFRRQWHPPESVGYRCLARGLSDIAAMGGKPLAAFLSLALPGDLPQVWVDRFMRGFLALAKRCSVPLAGGDTAQSPAGVLADIVVLGSVPRGTAVLRSGARPGDSLYVTGELGGSAVVLARLLAGSLKRPQPRRYPAHFFPTPRLAAGRLLRERKLATAMIDISDGLSTDLRHLCQESSVGARIYAQKLPAAGDAANLSFALHGGEDYELLFSARGNVPTRIAGVRLTRIGEITRGRKIVLVQDGREGELPAGGWEHFRRRR